MPYTPPTEPFIDNAQPVGGGVGSALDAPFFTALVAGVDDADTRITALAADVDDTDARVTDLKNTQPWLDLRAFGAAIDGATDDTAAIQAWMNTAAAQGKVAFHPGGVANHGALTVPHGLTMRGIGAGGFGVPVPDAQHSRFTAIAGVNANLWTGPVGVAHVHISDIHFDGNKNNNTSGDLFHLDNAATAEEAQWVWSRCFVDAAPGYGIYIGTGRRACKIVDKTTVNYSRLSGVRVNGSDSQIDRCIVGSNKVDGIQVGASITRITACDIYGNGTGGDAATGNGINVLSTITQVEIHGNGIDRNLRNGIYLSAAAGAVSVTGNMLHSNSQDGQGIAHHIHVFSAAGTIAVIGNTFGVDGGVTNNSGYCIFLNQATSSCDAHGNVAVPGSSNLGLTNDPVRTLNGKSSPGAQWSYAPQQPALVATLDPRSANGASAMTAAGQARGGRVIVPRSGKLRDVAIWVVTESGNVEVAVYDTTSTTRTRLWSTGSVACPAAGAWAIVGDPNLDVTAGQQLDLVLAADNTTVTFARWTAGGSWVQLPVNFYPASGGGKPALTWVASVTLPLAATLAEAAIGVGTTLPLIIARVT